MTLSSRVLPVLLAAVLALPACGTDAPVGAAATPADQAAADQAPADQAPADQATGVTRSRSQPARITVEVDGAVTIHWERDGEVRIVTVTPTERAVQLLSVGLEQLQDAGDGAWFRTAFDVVGGYDGPGTYTIAPAEDGAGIHSNAFLIHATVTDPDADPVLTSDNIDEVREFARATVACTVEVTADENSGSLTCPALADEAGDTVSLRMTWRAT